jgi:hypothetical protein
VEPFSYIANFEETDPVEFWTGIKDYTVNFKGMTDEKSAEGRKCLKIDITLGAGVPYVYWHIPMPGLVPAEGSLTFTGKVFLGGDTTAGRVEIGPSYSYPPSTVNGTCQTMYAVKSKESWLPCRGIW